MMWRYLLNCLCWLGGAVLVARIPGWEFGALFCMFFSGYNGCRFDSAWRRYRVEKKIETAKL
jgi:hypothetical protein